MLIWLMVPVARCSIDVFRDTPLSTIDGAVPADADKDRVDTGKGFFHAGLIFFARAALTSTKGLMPRILIVAAKRISDA